MAKRLSNKEIIETELMLMNTNGWEWDGRNLYTFDEWKKKGYAIEKGEKAFLTTNLWKPFNKKVKDSKGNETIETRFMLKKCYLFTNEQVRKFKYKQKTLF